MHLGDPPGTIGGGGVTNLECQPGTVIARGARCHTRSPRWSLGLPPPPLILDRGYVWVLRWSCYDSPRSVAQGR